LSTRERGKIAEDVAADYLIANGYRIVARNFSCKLGEIDIVALHNHDLVFVEVRSRGSASTLDPIFSINRKKQTKIVRAAEVYVDKHFKKEPPSRFDVVLVTMDDPPLVEHICDAFYAS